MRVVESPKQPPALAHISGREWSLTSPGVVDLPAGPGVVRRGLVGVEVRRVADVLLKHRVRPCARDGSGDGLPPVAIDPALVDPDAVADTHPRRDALLRADGRVHAE